MSMRDENLAALLAKLASDSLAYELVALLRDTDHQQWDETLAARMRQEVEDEVQGVSSDAEAQLDPG